MLREEALGDVGDGVCPRLATFAQGCTFVLQEAVPEPQRRERLRLVLAVENFGAFRQLMEWINHEIGAAVDATEAATLAAAGHAGPSPSSDGAPPPRDTEAGSAPEFELAQAFFDIQASVGSEAEAEELTLRKHQGVSLLAVAMREHSLPM